MGNVLAKDLRKAVLKAAFEGKLTSRKIHDTNPQKFINSLNYISNTKYKFSIDYPLDIPNYWVWTTIPQIAISYLGKTLNKSKDVGEEKPYLCSINISWDGVDLSFLKKAKFSEKEIEKYKLKKGDLLICEGGDVGKTVIWENDIDMYYQNALHRVRFAKNVCPYLYKYLMIYYKSIGILDDISKGMTFKHLVQGALFSLPIPFPPIEEQVRIVAKLDELMAKINEYEKLENELVQIKKDFSGDIKAAVLKAAMEGKLTEQFKTEHSSFIDAKANIDEYDYDIPENWNVVRMMSVSNLYTGNSISKSIKQSKYTGLTSGMNYIATKDVGFDHSITYENGVKIPFSESKFKIAKKNSTLLCIEGGSAGKKVGMISEEVCFGNKLCSFNAGEHINSKFQYYVILSPVFKKMFAENVSGMIGGVSVKKLKEMLIPLPPIEEQQRIVEKLDKLLPLCEELC